MQFVLVHGAWHDGHCWAEVAGALVRAGHRVGAPTLAGHGPGARRDVSHADCSRGVVEYIVQADLDEVVLVGHSFGGSVVQSVAEAIPARLRRLVFFNAFVLLDGQCVLDEHPPHYRAIIERLSRASGDGSFRLPFRVWRETFMNDADLATARRAWGRTSPEPIGPFRDRLRLPRFFGLDLPRSWLNARDDTALPPGPQWGWHPRLSGRLGPYRLVQMPGGHETLFTDPELLACKLIEAGRD